jgi:Tol biopolymer transport system component
MRHRLGACGAAVVCAVAAAPGLAAGPSGAARTSTAVPHGLIAFTVGGPEHADYQVVQAGGSGRRSVTARLGLNIEARQPVWSPGGRLLFFVHRDEDEGRRPIDTIRLDGRGLVRLTTSGDDGGARPAWSPSGRYLLLGDFRTDVEADEQLYVLDTRTRRRRILRRELTWSHATGVWSPTGKRVYAIRWRKTDDGRSEVDQLVAYTVRSGARRILFRTRDTEGRGSRMHGVAISPNGRQLAVSVSAGPPSTGCSVRVLAIASGRSWTVLHDAGSCSYGQPQWSPNGRQLAAAEIGRADGLPFVIHVVASNGTGRHPVLPQATGVHQDTPSWSPDGRWLALWRQSQSVDQIVVVRPDGSRAAVVAQAPASVGLGPPVWKP